MAGRAGAVGEGAGKWTVGVRRVTGWAGVSRLRLQMRKLRLREGSELAWSHSGVVNTLGGAVPPPHLTLGRSCLPGPAPPRARLQGPGGLLSSRRHKPRLRRKPWAGGRWAWPGYDTSPDSNASPAGPWALRPPERLPGWDKLQQQGEAHPQTTLGSPCTPFPWLPGGWAVDGNSGPAPRTQGLASEPWKQASGLTPSQLPLPTPTPGSGSPSSQASRPLPPPQGGPPGSLAPCLSLGPSCPRAPAHTLLAPGSPYDGGNGAELGACWRDQSHFTDGKTEALRGQALPTVAQELAPSPASPESEHLPHPRNS